MRVWQPAYIGIGSNLADPRAQVTRAAHRIAALAEVSLARLSPLYGSRPLGPADQPDFVNAVAGVLTRLEPEALLAALEAVEGDFGRPRVHERWGPRVIDLDLLVHGAVRRDGPSLTLPHPGIAERNFVLYPLADVAPDLEVPGLGRAADLKQRLSSEGLWRLDAASGAPAR
ncbi:MAG: 2-amino-4-hydroxy-6-hydroxymethyldihydropteridine diphosphokinase [Steroidobacteraceae bacterium]